MKTIRPIKLLSAVILLGLAAGVSAQGQPAQRNSSQAKSATVTHDTKEVGSDGRITERIVVTEDNGDGTITRIVQVIHPDGSTETRGERLAVSRKG